MAIGFTPCCLCKFVTHSSDENNNNKKKKKLQWSTAVSLSKRDGSKSSSQCKRDTFLLDSSFRGPIPLPITTTLLASKAISPSVPRTAIPLQMSEFQQ